MQPIEFADILSTDLQLAHTGYLTHALCFWEERFYLDLTLNAVTSIRQNLGISASEIRGGEK